MLVPGALRRKLKVVSFFLVGVLWGTGQLEVKKFASAEFHLVGLEVEGLHVEPAKGDGPRQALETVQQREVEVRWGEGGVPEWHRLEGGGGAHERLGGLSRGAAGMQEQEGAEEEGGVGDAVELGLDAVEQDAAVSGYL